MSSRDTPMTEKTGRANVTSGSNKQRPHICTQQRTIST